MWRINGTRVYVQDFSVSSDPVVARLQPFGNKSIYHKFGRQSAVYNLKGLFAGESKKQAILDLSYNTSLHTLETPWSTISGLVCSKVGIQAIKSSYQTFDKDASCTDQVYEFTLEFWKQE